MKTYSKFECVNIIDTLHKIMEHHTEHFQSDFEYDVHDLTEAALDRQGNRNFLWFCRQNGTSCYPDRDVYIHNTGANHGWQYYAGAKSEKIKAFWVEIDKLEDEIVTGNIVEINYEEHIKDVKQNSISANAVEVVFKHPNGVQTFDIEEYSKNRMAIHEKHGALDRLEYKVASENALQDVIANARNSYFEIAEPNIIGNYIQEMEARRFNEYGYPHDDKVFTTPSDATNALKHNLHVHALYPDGGEMRITTQKEIADHIYSGGIFGMSHDEKQLLKYLTADSTKVPALFTSNEMKLIYNLAIHAEISSGVNIDDLTLLDGVIYKLEHVMPPEQVEDNEAGEDMEL